MDISPTDHCLAEAMSLPPEARAYVAERLLASLDEEEPLTPEWAAEIDRRMAAHAKDPSKAKPIEDVLRRLDELAEGGRA